MNRSPSPLDDKSLVKAGRATEHVRRNSTRIGARWRNNPNSPREQWGKIGYAEWGRYGRSYCIRKGFSNESDKTLNRNGTKTRKDKTVLVIGKSYTRVYRCTLRSLHRYDKSARYFPHSLRTIRPDSTHFSGHPGYNDNPNFENSRREHEQRDKIVRSFR